MFQQNKKSIINYGHINHQTKLGRTDLFCKQTSLNLVIFDKNEGNFREKKIFQKMLNPFFNGGLHLVRLISWVVICCYVILM